jgi:ABC-type transport system involved in cytochrome bd biosynthesis fused ATPase/permease subunit
LYRKQTDTTKDISLQLDNDESELLIENIVGLDKITMTWENIEVNRIHSNTLFNNIRSKLDKNYVAEKKIIKNSNHIFLFILKLNINQNLLILIILVSGIASSGEVLAILGSSGSGKTTLLNVLNFRNPGSLQSSGFIRINGKIINKFEKIAPISGYVQQDDLFIGSLKVREHLIFQV